MISGFYGGLVDADDENLIIALASAYQRRTEWHLAHPPGLVF